MRLILIAEAAMVTTARLTCLLLTAPLAAALSSGPKSCDAIDLCPGGVCPDGMELVGPPTRSAHYRLETDSSSWSPGELVTLRHMVTQRDIQARRNAGALQCECQQTGGLSLQKHAERPCGPS